jgi:hypothetical protein
MEFEKMKITGLDGHAEWVFTEKSESLNPFQIKISRRGVSFSGQSSDLYEHSELQVFAKVMGDAWTKFVGMKPKIVSPSAGH